jgi:hypothetical protein
MKLQHKLVFNFTAVGLVAFAGILGAIEQSAADDPPQHKGHVKVIVRPKDQPSEPTQPPQAPGETPAKQPKPTRKSQSHEPSRLPELPPSAIPQNNNPQEQPRESRQDVPSDLAAQVLTHKFGPERVQQILNSVQDAGGEGAPNSSPYFDGAHVLTGNGEITPREQTQFFRGSPAAPSQPTSAANSTYVITTVQGPTGSSDLKKAYGSVPGGVVLEGQADIGPLENLTYDARFNAFVVDDRAAYFLKVSPSIVVELCRALAEKDEIGVSLGAVQISYGALPKKSRLARDLMLADNFLGDIAFGKKEWTAGYIFANGYEPRQFHGSIHAAVFFRFSGFQFQVDQQELKVGQESFTDQFIPLTDERAADGGSLPDEAAIMEGRGNAPLEYEMNLRHIAENMSYYRREKLIDQVFSYGATAAFLRGLKAQGVDLAELADAIAADTGS